MDMLFSNVFGWMDNDGVGGVLTETASHLDYFHGDVYSGDLTGVSLLAYAHEDKTGLVAEMLRQSIRHDTTLQSARTVVHGHHFYGDIAISGMPGDVIANISDAIQRSLFRGTIVRVRPWGPSMAPRSMRRREIAVTAGSESALIAFADLAAERDISIAYCDAARKDAAEGTDVLEAMFHVDIPEYDPGMFTGLVEELIRLDDGDLIDLAYRTWDLDE